MQTIKVPVERIPVLLGESGETKEYLEKRLNLKLEVDPEGEVQMEGESVDEFIGKDVVKAIGRGFAPAVALKLLSDEYGFKLINLRDYESSHKAQHRIMGRVIGEKGRTKEIIKEEIGADIACFGHTVGVICRLDTLDFAMTAIYKLIEGSPHANVYGYLEKCRRKIKESEVKKLF